MENLRIATWDIKNSYFKISKNIMKAACVTELLSLYDLDVLVLQEVNPILAKNIDECLKKSNRGYRITSPWRGPNFNLISNLCMEQNIIISRFKPTIHNYNMPLPREIRLSRPNTMRRYYLIGQEFDDNIYINSTNLGYVDKYVSMLQLDYILDELEFQSAYGKQPFLLGNLNRKTSGLNKQHFDNLLLSFARMKLVDNPHRTYVKQVEDEPVDHIAIPANWEVSTVETIEGYEDISTHYPVVVEAKKLKK